MKFFLAISLLMLSCLFCSAFAGDFISPLFSSNMVFPYNEVTTILGTTAAGSTAVKVELLLSGTPIETKTTTSDATGFWSITGFQHATNSVHSLKITYGVTVFKTFTNIVFGDVILCSGQSNMDWSLNNAIADTGFAHATAASALKTSLQTRTNLRFLVVSHASTATPQYHINAATSSGAGWASPTSTTQTGLLSAVCAFAADKITLADTTRHIGLIDSAVGATAICQWYPGSPACTNGKQTSGHYNAMIYPLQYLRIKSVFWYQGESDVGLPFSYPGYLYNLINKWRDLWGTYGASRKNIPFYVATLAGHTSLAGFGVMRYQQHVATDYYYSYAVHGITIADLGHTTNIHPDGKHYVGRRISDSYINNKDSPQFSVFCYQVNPSLTNCEFTYTGHATSVTLTQTQAHPSATCNNANNPIKFTLHGGWKGSTYYYYSGTKIVAQIYYPITSIQSIEYLVEDDPQCVFLADNNKEKVQFRPYFYLF